MGVLWGRSALVILMAAALLVMPAAAGAQVPAPGLVIDQGVMADRGDGDRHGAERRYVLDPALKWRGSKTITYYNKAKSYESQVKRAAAAWNKSGAKVRWKPTSLGQAKVVIRIDSNLPTAGQANTNGTSATILLQPGIGNPFPSKPEGEAIETAVVAHEMGHVMGLHHEPRKCATMNAILWDRCKSPDELWEYRCRPLEPDDARGGAKAFGGRPKSLPRPFCALGKEPSAVNDFLATYDAAQDEVVLTWALPSQNPPKDLTIYRGKRDGDCPDRDGKESSAAFDARPQNGQIKDGSAGTGTYCYTAVSFNEFGRPGGIAKSTVAVTGEPPTAEFYYEQAEGTSVEFFDFSEDPNDDIVSWDWDFGDGSAGSTIENPVHTFPQYGNYEVTLTVTDQGGGTDQFTQTIPVALGEAPFPDFGYTPLTGTAIQFDDLSSDEDGDIVSWEWDFGDGSQGSTDEDPTHTYATTGEYDVTLRVIDNDGNADSITQAITVAQGAPPEADFGYSQLSGTTVEFYDYSYDPDGDIASWEWDFGDGSPGSTEPEPMHTFSAPGEYVVTLTVTDDAGNSASVEDTVYVD